MSKVHYCDRCGKEISTWNNEYSQVMSVDITIDGGESREIFGGTTEFCSPTCAIEYLKGYKKIEDHWLDVWKRGKILGVAPVRPKKKERRD